MRLPTALDGPCCPFSALATETMLYSSGLERTCMAFLSALWQRWQLKDWMHPLAPLRKANIATGSRVQF